MFKKKSIFIRVLIPVVVVMMLQTLLISMVLFVNGTLRSLDDSAIESLRKSAENRLISLENTMIFNWSNLDKLEIDIIAEIDAYLNKNNMSMADVTDNSTHEINILSNVSQAMINALRGSMSTGVFMYFVGDGDCDEERAYNGLYYRDLDPIVTPANYSDILFLRGNIKIARKDRIQLDSLWNEDFTFSPDYPDAWSSFVKPIIAAKEYPEASSIDLSYWCKPHFISSDSSSDTNKCITYTRPLIYNGKLIAMIGTEIQTRLIENYIPASDFDSADKSGYMLVEYEGSSTLGTVSSFDVLMITGSYIKRIIPLRSDLSLKPTKRGWIYNIDPDDRESVSISIHPLRLYNTNAPYSNEKWAIAVISLNSTLFESSRKVAGGIIYSSAFALALGCIVIYFIIRASTKPLISLADQIEKSNTDDLIIASKSNISEIVLLCSTINVMREKRNHVESQLREERERYLVALESAADTFMEYDTVRDTFKLYYFSDTSAKPQICTDVLTNFTDKLYKNQVTHLDDITRLALFVSSRADETAEIRFKASIFPHIKNVALDDGYLWFLLKIKRLYDDNRKVIKVIGTARNITEEKLSEFREAEIARRDPTTGFYNREHGLSLVDDRLYNIKIMDRAFSICMLHIKNLDSIEAYYGRIFGGVLLMQLSKVLLRAMTEKDLGVRLSNDGFLILFEDVDKSSVRKWAAKFFEDISRLYTGENADLRLSVSLGAVMSTDNNDTNELIQCAWQAAQYAAKTECEELVFYDDLPMEAASENIAQREKPISVFLDISKNNFISFSFELFERTSDVRSAINILLSVLGGMFDLRQIVIQSYDSDFGADKLTYQWNSRETAQYHSNIDRVSHREMQEFEALMAGEGYILFDHGIASRVSSVVSRLLCIVPGQEMSAFCCLMHENGLQNGRIVYKAEYGKEWDDGDMLVLFEVTKIIAAHITIEKSNQASRFKSEFLSRVSHDMRTPMNAIIGLTGIAKKSVVDQQLLNGYLEKIDFSAKHLLSLINDVLDMSRIESGKLNITYTSISISYLVKCVDILMRTPIESKGLSFNTRLDIVHDEVLCDEYRLRQVLVNLLGNANKFTRPGGMIEFSIVEIRDGDAIQENRLTDDRICSYKFSVKDTGIGISKEDMMRIFIAFEQVKTSSEHQGTGLGLAISANIISMMGGKIEVESNPGDGSNFYFTLGLKLGDNGGAVIEQKEEAVDYSSCFKGKRALLVEDNDINVEIALYMLEDVGFEVETARNGQEAVNEFNASSQGYYDVILMDIQMPVMDGLTATRMIRKNKERADARKVPIVAMTANAFDEDMKKSIESGMNGHIAKPIDNQMFYELLKDLLY